MCNIMKSGIGRHKTRIKPAKAGPGQQLPGRPVIAGALVLVVTAGYGGADAHTVIECPRVSLAYACRPRSKYFSPVNDRELCPTSIYSVARLNQAFCTVS